MTASDRSYLIINLIFAGIVVAILCYSGIFSPVANNYPVQCIHEKLTGIPCPSCGMSHSFSYIIRGNFAEALIWNSYGIRVFLFFILQLILRLSISFSLVKGGRGAGRVLTFDIIVTSAGFLLAFSQFIIYNARLLF